MARASVALEPITESPEWFPAQEFAWGKPATRFEIVVGEVVSFVDLFRIARDEDAEPLSLAFVRLAMLVLVGVAATALVGYAFGVVVADGYASFAG